MGGGSSRQTMAIPQYPMSYNPAGSYNPAPITPYSTYPRNVVTLSKREMKQLNDAYQTIQNFQSRVPPTMRPAGGSRPPTPPPTYPGPPIMNVSQPPSPRTQRAYGQYPAPYPPPPAPVGYRDSDYAAVANISGLNPADVALLHREYMNLTRGGRTKIDRVVFRQILRGVLIEANNENIDRALENIFISIDRNRDGFIDFSEFVGAFRDVLKTESPDPSVYNPPLSLSDLLNQQARPNTAAPTLICQPLPVQSSPQVITIPSTDFQQPLVCSNSTPMVLSLDSNQSSCIPMNQYQQSSFQCMPLPM